MDFVETSEEEMVAMNCKYEKFVQLSLWCSSHGIIRSMGLRLQCISFSFYLYENDPFGSPAIYLPLCRLYLGVDGITNC